MHYGLEEKKREVEKEGGQSQGERNLERDGGKGDGGRRRRDIFILPDYLLKSSSAFGVSLLTIRYYGSKNCFVWITHHKMKE